MNFGTTKERDLAEARERRATERAARVANILRFHDGTRTVREVAAMAGVSFKAAKHTIARHAEKTP